eukprot:COSAG02_NODE_9951_length_2066_cov_2.105236_2_plen_160_part_00
MRTAPSWIRLATLDERAAVSRGWQDNTKAVGEMVVSKGGWPYPYFELASRNETRPDVTCQRDMQAMCKVNATTKRPNIHDQCLLLEFSRVSHMSEKHSCFEFSILALADSSLDSGCLIVRRWLRCGDVDPNQVWTREWTKASVSLDCNSYQAKINMKDD